MPQDDYGNSDFLGKIFELSLNIENEVEKMKNELKVEETTGQEHGGVDQHWHPETPSRGHLAYIWHMVSAQ